MGEEKKDIKKDVKKDDKKDEKKSGGGMFGIEWGDVVLLILGLIAIFAVIIPRLNPDRSGELFGTDTVPRSGFDIKTWYHDLLNPHTEVVQNASGEVITTTIEPSLVDEAKFRVTDLFKNILYIIFFTCIFLCLLFWLIIYHNKIRLKFVTDEYSKTIAPAISTSTQDIHVPPADAVDTNGIQNPRWELIEKYYNSGNQSDWRLAIIEADIMLYDLLDRIGVLGDSIGEKLKNTNKAQMGTIDLAWRAHKVRNELAHQGSSFEINRHIVEQAIEDYRKVFSEFSYI